MALEHYNALPAQPTPGRCQIPAARGAVPKPGGQRAAVKFRGSGGQRQRPPSKPRERGSLPWGDRSRREPTMKH